MEKTFFNPPAFALRPGQPLRPFLARPEGGPERPRTLSPDHLAHLWRDIDPNATPPPEIVADMNETIPPGILAQWADDQPLSEDSDSPEVLDLPVGDSIEDLLVRRRTTNTLEASQAPQAPLVTAELQESPYQSDPQMVTELTSILYNLQLPSISNNLDDSDIVESIEEDEPNGAEDDDSETEDLEVLATVLGLGLTAEEIKSGKILITKNSIHDITVGEFDEHLCIPEYPRTSAQGVLHFIHLPINPL